MMKRIAVRGFTLVEMLVTITILGTVANAVVPLLSSNEPQKLRVAAEETANTLRFALSEAKRTNGYVLVDGQTTAGRLKLYYSDINANLGAVINDPLTKRASDLNVTSSAFSQGVALTPQIRAGGQVRALLLIDPTQSNLKGLVSIGAGTGGGLALQANSGVLLTLGSQSVLVSINQTTGLVTLP
jgi:prepilin-type N-terminal cleavage/methylation domain-containing protein